MQKSLNLRNQTIDVLRAFTMFAMIFVNDFWKIHDVPHWLEHAAYGEDFLGLSDLVFPIFLFVVGLSIPYAIENRHKKGFSVESTLSHIFTRTLALLIMGVFIGNSELRLSPDAPYGIGAYWIIMVVAFLLIWNTYPKSMQSKKGLVALLQFIGLAMLFFLAITFRNTKGGVFSANYSILGAIGFSYLFCSIAYLLSRTKPKHLFGVGAVLVLICMLNTPLRESLGGQPLLNLPERNFYNSFLSLFNIGNGVLAAFTMSGVLFSLGIQRYQNKPLQWKVKTLIGLCLIMLIAGFITHNFWIVSKIGGTPPWLFYTLSVVIALYLIFMVMEHYGKLSVFKIIKPAGTATLTVYLIPYVSYAFAEITGIVLPDLLTHGFMGLLNCLCFSLLIILIAGRLEKMNIKLKI